MTGRGAQPSYASDVDVAGAVAGVGEAPAGGALVSLADDGTFAPV